MKGTDFARVRLRAISRILLAADMESGFHSASVPELGRRGLSSSDSVPSDVIIVGAGPAGLTAALYLGRFHRAPRVIDGGASRARWIPTSHNIPGFTEGVGGTELLAQLRAQASRYGARFLPGTVSAISRQENGFVLSLGSHVETCRFVILATGVKDQFPALAGAEEAVLRSVLRFCPVCDGFEATDRRIAVLGNGEHGEREAQFLFQTYSSDVCYLDLGADTSRGQALRALGVSVRNVSIDELCVERDGLWLHPRLRASERFDVVYAALGCTPQHQLAEHLGADCDEKGALIVNTHQQTSVDRLYAAGDVVRGLNQVIVAAAEGAIAATDIHNRLR